MSLHHCVFYFTETSRSVDQPRLYSKQSRVQWWKYNNWPGTYLSLIDVSLYSVGVRLWVFSQLSRWFMIGFTSWQSNRHVEGNLSFCIPGFLWVSHRDNRTGMLREISVFAFLDFFEFHIVTIEPACWGKSQFLHSWISLSLWFHLWRVWTIIQTSLRVWPTETPYPTNKTKCQIKLSVFYIVTHPFN